MGRDNHQCARCGRLTPFHLLDAKPSRIPFRYRIIALLTGRTVIDVAARHGADFDRLECSRCYGPGWKGDA